MWRVMQRTETGEEFNTHEARSEDAAYDWINENEDDFPESTFWVEACE
jgi:hypothetical protein